MILVFGAAGFIGTYLTDQLVTSGLKVVASDISEMGRAHYGERGIPYCLVDITRGHDFEHLPSHDIDAVVHLACVQPANVSAESYRAADFARVNILGTLNILDFCRINRIPKIIYTCSHRNTQGLWAEKAGKPIQESDGRSIEFTGDYAMFSISESAATDCVEHYAQTYGIEGVVFRLPPVYGYGPHMEIFREGRPLKTGFQVFIEKAQNGRPLELWGDPQNGRDVVYVKDVVSAIELALERPGIGGLFNISSGRRLTLREQAECTIKAFSPPDRPSPIEYLPAKPNLLDSYVYDIGKAEMELGWQPRYSFAEMLVDCRKEMESGRFAFLLEKRHLLMEEASSIEAQRQSAVRSATDSTMEDSMDLSLMPGAELMGENVKAKLKSCGEGVRLMPLAKVANAHVVEIGDSCRVCDFVFIWGGQGTKIGAHCDIQPHVAVWGGGWLEIGDRVSVGPGTVLLTAVYSHEEGLKMVDGLSEGSAKGLYGKLTVESDVYIGANCTLMPDIVVGEGAVIGAGSFVNRDCDAGGIYIGSPAKKIGVRPKPEA